MPSREINDALPFASAGFSFRRHDNSRLAPAAPMASNDRILGESVGLLGNTNYDTPDSAKDRSLSMCHSLASHHQAPASDDTTSGTDSAGDEPKNDPHIPSLRAPTALRPLSGFPDRLERQMSSAGTPQPNARMTLNKLALKGSFPRLRPGKSLQQRLNVSEKMDEDLELPPLGIKAEYRVPHIINSISSQVPRLPRSHTPHPESIMPSAYSRNVSVISHNIGHDEDISSLMIRGATDLRTAKFEIEEQRKEIARLQTQLDSIKEEKAEALQRIKTIKETAKHSLEKSSKSLDGMRASLDELKAQSAESVTFVSQAKSCLGNVQELRETVSTSLKSIEPLLDDDGHLFKTLEMRSVIGDFQLECTNSQQVIDLLRDRLETVGSELVDAKNRVGELEQSQAGDKEAIRTLSTKLADSASVIAALAEQLKQQQSQSHDVLIAAADFEAKLAASQQENSKLLEDTLSKDKEIDTLRLLEQQNATLEATLQAKNAYIAQLEPLKEQLADAHSKSNSLELKLSATETDILAKQYTLDVFQNRISTLEAELNERGTEIIRIRELLSGSNATEDALRKANVLLQSEREALDVKVLQGQTEIRDIRKESESRTEKLHDANTRYKVMEERFQDQSITLRLTQESLGDMQDRMIESEAKFAKELEARSASLKCQLAVVTTQNESLREKVDDLQHSLKSKDNEIHQSKLTFQQELEDKEKNLNSIITTTEQKVVELEELFAESRAENGHLQEDLSVTNASLQTVEAQLREAQAIPKSLKAEIDMLRRQMDDHHQEIIHLNNRAKTIGARYRTGDLNEEEKAFTNSLVQTSQSIHEQELIAKGNELRRRDNNIVELRSRINLLEATLAKHLKSQAKAHLAMGAGNRSLIDPATWTSSDRSSPPSALGAEVQRPTELESNVPKSAQGTSHREIVHDTSLPTSITPMQDVHHATTYRTPTVPKTPAPVVAPKTPDDYQSSRPLAKPKFGHLARVSSDEIEDFEEPQALSPPVKLGKRSQQDRPLTPAKADSSRQTKRSRGGTRNKPEGKANNQALTNKVVETAPKTRSRRKR